MAYEKLKGILIAVSTTVLLFLLHQVQELKYLMSRKTDFKLSVQLNIEAIISMNCVLIEADRMISHSSTCLETLFFFFFFFFIPRLYLWGSPFRLRFLCMGPFFNPTIEVVTFRLRGWWCMLGVFLLWHSPIEDMNVIFRVCAIECMCAQARPRFKLSSERGFGEWSLNPC